MRADGSQQQKLAKYPGGGQISSCISWSPDGKRIAFMNGTGHRDISAIRPDGKQIAYAVLITVARRRT